MEVDDFVSEILDAVAVTEDGKRYKRILNAIEKELFSQALFRCRYNQSNASKFLGVSRTYFRKKLNVYFGKGKKQHKANLGIMKDE